MIFVCLLADKNVTELTNTNDTDGELKVAETGTMAAVGTEDQPSDAAAFGPSILVLNDLWRYVPAYFQTVDAFQPRSEAGRRLLERRRRQLERQQQQQQQQQQRNTAVRAPEAGENQRGTLPVDQLLAYITNSATNNTSETSMSGSCRGRRKKKQVTRSSDALVDGSTSLKHIIDDAEGSYNENMMYKVEKKEQQPANSTASIVANGDVADFVVVRRGRKYKTSAMETPTQLQSEVPLGKHHRLKATFCDSLDEFSLQGDRVTTYLANRASNNKIDVPIVNDERSELVTTTSTLTKSSQISPLSTNVTHMSEELGYCTNVNNSTRSSECQRPVTLRYNDVVKRNRQNWQQNSVVLDVSSDSPATHQHHQPYLTPNDVDCVQTTNSPTITNVNDEQEKGVSTTDDHVVDVLDSDSSTGHTKNVAVGRTVKTVSCSTQTSSIEMPQYSTPPPSTNSTAVADITGKGNSLQRSNPVVFLDAKADNNEVLQAGSKLSFGSFDDIMSTSLGSPSRDNDKVVDTSESACKCSDAATSPIKLFPLTCSSPTSDTKQLTTSNYCRRITPLCRKTGSSSCATGAPVGIVPPIMHVETAVSDANISVDENSTREKVNHQFIALVCGMDILL